MSTALLNSDPESSSWLWLAGLGEPWSGFQEKKKKKPPPNTQARTHTHTHTHTNYAIVSITEALIKRVQVVK